MFDWRGTPSVDMWNATMDCVRRMNMFVVPNRSVLSGYEEIVAYGVISANPCYLDSHIVCSEGAWDVQRDQEGMPTVQPNSYAVDRQSLLNSFRVAARFRNCYYQIPWLRGELYNSAGLSLNGILPTAVMPHEVCPGGTIPTQQCAYCSNQATWSTVNGPLYNPYPIDQNVSTHLCEYHVGWLLTGSSVCGDSWFYPPFPDTWPGWDCTPCADEHYLKILFPTDGQYWPYAFMLTAGSSVNDPVRTGFYAAGQVGGSDIGLPIPLALCPDGTQILDAKIEFQVYGGFFNEWEAWPIDNGDGTVSIPMFPQQMTNYESYGVKVDLIGVRHRWLGSGEYSPSHPPHLSKEYEYLCSLGGAEVRTGQGRTFVVDATEGLQKMFDRRREFLTFLAIARPAIAAVSFGTDVDFCNILHGYTANYRAKDFDWRYVRHGQVDLGWQWIAERAKGFTIRFDTFSASKIAFRLRLPDNAVMQLDWRNWPSMREIGQ